jgi:hypothetical protein
LSRFVTIGIKTADFSQVIFGEAYPKLGLGLSEREETTNYEKDP